MVTNTFTVNGSTAAYTLTANLDQELVNELKEKWGDNREVMYPTARVNTTKRF